MGLEVLPSIGSLPEGIDVAVSILPALASPDRIVDGMLRQAGYVCCIWNRKTTPRAAKNRFKKYSG